jgi:type IV pilus biogenesis protein CpaD/CtpE
MKRTTPFVPVLATALALGLAACERRAEEPDPEPPPQVMEHGMEVMHSQDMDAMMRRHAEEMEAAVERMETQIGNMHEAGANRWYELTVTHVREVSGFLSLMRRQMREMDMGMGMDDDHMGEMMGMSGAEHRQMMTHMEEVGRDLERLQVGSREEVRTLMPEHLDRLEQLVEMAERSAEHMGSM